MNAAISNRVPTTTILSQIKTALAALQINIGGNPATAFARVEQFDNENLGEAFQRLFISEQRICLVVVLDEQFKKENNSQKMIITRTLPVTLLISDRQLGSRLDALYGNATTPGAFALMEAVLPIVTGMLIPPAAPLSGVTCEPVNNTVIVIKDNEKQNLPGRAAVALELHCLGGNLQANLGPQPVL